MAEIDPRDAEIMWLRSSLVALLTLAKAEHSPLTNANVVSICEAALGKFDHPPMSGVEKSMLG